MPSHKLLAGVVSSVLTKFVSRYGSYQGYWLMGWFVLEGRNWHFDLASAETANHFETRASAKAHSWARHVLRDQLLKHRFAPQIVSQAKLEVQLGNGGPLNAKTALLKVERSRHRLLEQREVTVKLVLTCVAVCETKVYENQITVFAASHSALSESCSGQQSC